MDVRLEDADDAVGAAVDSRAVHLVLLVHHLYNGRDDTLLVEEQKLIPFVVFCEDAQKLAKVLCKTVKQVGDGVFEQSALLHLLFDEQQIGTAGILIVGLPACDTEFLAYFRRVFVNLAAGSLKKGGIYRIADLRICTCGINLQDSLVLPVLRVCKLSRIRVFRLWFRRFISFVPGILFCMLTAFFKDVLLLKEQFGGHGVNLLFADSLADSDKQTGVEYRLVGELGQSAEILHVGILADDVYRLLVGKTKFVLDYHRTHYHTGRLVASSFLFVVKF